MLGMQAQSSELLSSAERTRREGPESHASALTQEGMFGCPRTPTGRELQHSLLTR